MPKRRHEWQESVGEAVQVTRDYLADNADRALGGTGGGGGDLDVVRGPNRTPEGFLPRYLLVGQKDGTWRLEDYDQANARRGNAWNDPPGYLPENHVGGVVGSARSLVYPAISTCIGLLLCLPGRIAGVHLTIGTRETELEQMVAKLSAEFIAGRRILAVFAFGPPTRWTGRTGWKDPRPDAMPWKTEGFDGAVANLKARLGYAGQAWVYDQQGGTSMSYRATLLRAYASPGVTLERGPNGAQGDQWVPLEAAAFRLL
jgi:hypothetical protein